MGTPSRLLMGCDVFEYASTGTVQVSTTYTQHNHNKHEKKKKIEYHTRYAT